MIDAFGVERYDLVSKGETGTKVRHALGYGALAGGIGAGGAALGFRLSGKLAERGAAREAARVTPFRERPKLLRTPMPKPSAGVTDARLKPRPKVTLNRTTASPSASGVHVPGVQPKAAPAPAPRPSASSGTIGKPSDRAQARIQRLRAGPVDGPIITPPKRPGGFTQRDHGTFDTELGRHVHRPVPPPAGRPVDPNFNPTKPNYNFPRRGQT